MADLNLDMNYFEHPKTRRLVAALGPGADVYPIRLWCYAAKHYPKSGRLVGHSAEEIDNLLGFAAAGQPLFSGRMPGELTRKMQDLGFLDLDGETYVVHGWKKRNGHISAFANRASHAAKVRWKKIKGDAPSIASSNAVSSAKPPAEHSPNPPPKPTQPTKPTSPPNQANGAGEQTAVGGPGGIAAPSGRVGGGNGVMAAAGAEILRAANVEPNMDSRATAVSGMLLKLGVGHKARNELCDRRDITPELVRETVNALSRSGTVNNLPAVLVTRLREHR